MNRKKIITLSAIVLLLVLIGVKELLKQDTVPALAKIEGTIDKIEIGRDATTLILEKSGDTWLIGTEKFPVSKAASDKIVSIVQDLRLYEKVSAKKNYEKYDLGDKGVTLKAYSSGKVVREITVGKQSSSSSQAYLLLKDDPAVYLAGNFSVNDLRKGVADMREKTIVKLSEDAISKIDINYGGTNYTLTKEEKADPDDSQKKIFHWAFAGDSTVLNQDSVKAILAKFDPLMADTYVEEYVEPVKPLAQVSITAYEKTVVLNIYEKKDDANYIAKCSESPYYFQLAPFKVEPLLKKKDELK